MIAHAQNSGRQALVLLTGATGYVGGRLAPELLSRGYRLRCVARDPRKLMARDWTDHPDVEIVQGDLCDEQALAAMMHGCDAAYYLVHSMLAAGAGYAARDLQLAQGFARSARKAHLPRIIYLGGLGEDGHDLSRHLASRRNVERTLRSTGVSVTVLRAAMIIGSGSASFEILRYLVERLPIMMTPRWVRTSCQPISVRNVVGYLADALKTEHTAGLTLDIGGPQIVTYHDLMRMMADALMLRKPVVIPVPVLTPRLSALWIHLVTPLSSRIARPLAEGLRNRVVCRDEQAQLMMPQQLLSPRQAIEAAIVKVRGNQVRSAWFDAGPIPGDPDWSGGTTFTDRRKTYIPASPKAVFAAICRVGGGHGYYAADWLWRVRGILDRLVGGPGLRRGRRHPFRLAYGDALDFWRIIKIVSDQSLELRAEMKLPGIATLSFELSESEAGTCLKQTARFRPRGLAGLLYWYAVWPLHGIVFRGLLKGIHRAALTIHEEIANAQISELDRTRAAAATHAQQTTGEVQTSQQARIDTIDK